MSDPVRWLSSPAQMLLQTHSYPKASAICAGALDDKLRCFWSMLVLPASAAYSPYDETASLLVSRSKPDGPIYGSPPTQPDDFRPVRLISEGVSGKVYLVEDKVSKKNFALKVIRKRSDNLTSNLIQVINEKDALCKVAGDPWFLSLEASMHDDTNFYLITVRFQAPTDDPFCSDELSF